MPANTRDGRPGRGGFCLSILVSAGFLGGCAAAMGWSRANTSEAQFNADRAQCEEQATRRYPVRMASFVSGHEAPSQSNCSGYGGHLNCSAAPGSYVAPRQADLNASDRNDEVRSCLQARGYVSKPMPGPSTPRPSPEREEFVAAVAR